METTIEKLKGLRAGQKLLSRLPEDQRVLLLKKIASNLLTSQGEILAANAKDRALAQKAGLAASLLDRLVLNEERLKALSQAVLAIADMPPVLNQVHQQWTRPDGLQIRRVSVPLGVIFFIFESRPNVVVDAVALAIKSGNGMLLKGGREAEWTNSALMESLYEALEAFGVAQAFALLPSADRSQVAACLASPQWIDLVIPRGGAELVSYVRSHTQIPVIAHDKGMCHLYIHSDALKDQSIALVLNSKASRPGVCNALETLLIHKDWPYRWDVVEELLKNQVELRVDPFFFQALQNRKTQGATQIRCATPEDWNTEHLALVLNIKLVNSLDEAMQHIETYGSHHTEVICTQDQGIMSQFTSHIDASCVGINASTRFNDGGELGLGAEIGISTSKLHAYGPMGAAQLVTIRFEVLGAGHRR